MMDQRSRISVFFSSLWVGCFALALMAFASASLAAEPSGDDTVSSSDACLTDNLCKGHYDEARKAYKDKRYDEAYKEYKSAYERRQAPWLLINVGRCLQRLGRNKEALDFYQRYSKADPNPKPETVVRVNGYIEQVKAGIVEEPEAKPEPKPDPKPEPQVTANVPPPVQTPVEPEKTPVYKKWWFWTIVGVVAAGAIAGGVAGGLYANRGTVEQVQTNPAVPSGITVYTPSF